MPRAINTSQEVHSSTKEPITISPTENKLELPEGSKSHEDILVRVPGNPGVPKLDVYLLADSTGSMQEVFDAVRKGAKEIVNAIKGASESVAFGVGDYKDFPYMEEDNPYAFKSQVNLTPDEQRTLNVIADKSIWKTYGGSDGSEGQLFALDQLARTGEGSVGWRPGSRRIIVWFGDAPGHDPICPKISTLVHDSITEDSVTKKLQAAKITVIAISLVTTEAARFKDGLDDDPNKDADDYKSDCPPSGKAGQATRIIQATGGKYESGIEPEKIVETIVGLVKQSITTINNVKLVATGKTARFVASISPAEGYGPFSGGQAQNLKFAVDFTGVEHCATQKQAFTGTFDVVADGTVVAQKQVEITVPHCSHKDPDDPIKPDPSKDKFLYIVMFICGFQGELTCCEHNIVRPGMYTTEIIIYNYQGTDAHIEKFVVPVVFAGSPLGREPRFAGQKGYDQMVLPPNSATMDDCHRIGELLFGGQPPSPLPLMVGTLKITSPQELHVTAVYTANNLASSSISIDVKQIERKIQ